MKFELTENAIEHLKNDPNQKKEYRVTVLGIG